MAMTRRIASFLAIRSGSAVQSNHAVIYFQETLVQDSSSEDGNPAGRMREIRRSGIRFKEDHLENCTCDVPFLFYFDQPCNDIRIIAVVPAT